MHKRKVQFKRFEKIKNFLTKWIYSKYFIKSREIMLHPRPWHVKNQRKISNSFYNIVISIRIPLYTSFSFTFVRTSCQAELLFLTSFRHAVIRKIQRNTNVHLCTINITHKYEKPSYWLIWENMRGYMLKICSGRLQPTLTKKRCSIDVPDQIKYTNFMYLSSVKSIIWFLN